MDEEMKLEVSLDNMLKYKNQLFSETYIPKINDYVAKTKELIKDKDVIFFYPQNVYHYQRNWGFVFFLSNKKVYIYYPKQETRKLFNIDGSTISFTDIDKETVKLEIKTSDGYLMILDNDITILGNIIVDNIIVDSNKIKSALKERLKDIFSYLENNVI